MERTPGSKVSQDEGACAVGLGEGGGAVGNDHEMMHAEDGGQVAIGIGDVISTVDGSTALISLICLAMEFTFEPTAGSRWRFSE